MRWLGPTAIASRRWAMGRSTSTGWVRRRRARARVCRWCPIPSWRCAASRCRPPRTGRRGGRRLASCAPCPRLSPFKGVFGDELVWLKNAGAINEDINLSGGSLGSNTQVDLDANTCVEGGILLGTPNAAAPWKTTLLAKETLPVPASHPDPSREGESMKIDTSPRTPAPRRTSRSSSTEAERWSSSVM